MVGSLPHLADLKVVYQHKEETLVTTVDVDGTNCKAGGYLVNPI